MKRRVLLAVAVVLVACAGPVVRRRSALLMDTFVTVTVIAERGLADRAIDSVFARLATISRKFNHLDSTSPVYAFNNRGMPITDSEVVELVRFALAASEFTGGAFDITVEPLVRLWGFYGGSPALPGQRAIDSCRAFVGWRKLAIEDGRVVRTDPHTTIDLGGIAKGYALKEAAAVLRAMGVSSALIDAGGDIYCIGGRGRRDWKVGIRHPRGDGIISVVAVRDQAVVTSGDYERFFYGPDSVRYCHIIDPATGWPARGLVSTTVVSADPVLAQVLAKALFILGPEKFAGLDSAKTVGWLGLDEGLNRHSSDSAAGVFFDRP